MTRLLLVEDDPRISGFVRRGLKAEGYVVDLAENGREALALAAEAVYPLIILDRMLPGVDGIEVCRELRKLGLRSMILMLTAKDSLKDKVDGFSSGADDYLTKPFAFDELVVRLQALLRRGPHLDEEGPLVVGDLTLDPSGHSVRRGGRDIALTAREFALLHYLMRHAGKVVSRTRLLANVWGYSFEPGTKTVDVYIRYLRRKIDEGEAEPLIQTVRGFGYKLSAGGTGAARTVPREPSPPSARNAGCLP
ncbi:response regulator transcription factor [Afifella sp. YEN Y35]|uniref:response regulator transcription factor n=1 Tax=Afifella sp. YEN Y35 TaxID=3388337 RepID=UPI0039E0F6F0